jgi:hypothetical protein
MPESRSASCTPRSSRRVSCVSAQRASGRNWHTQLIFERSLPKIKSARGPRRSLTSGGYSKARFGIKCGRCVNETNHHYPVNQGCSASLSPNKKHRAAVPNLNQLLDQWLTTVVKARVRTRTFKDYEAPLKLFIRPALGGRLIGTLSQIDIQNLYAQMLERGLSARTIEYANAVLRSAFRQAVRWKMLVEDPCVGVDLPRVKHKEMEA